MAELEEDIIKESEYKQYLWWSYIDGICFLWKNKLKSIIVKINKLHRNIKFTTAEWSKTSINFLDATVPLIEEVTETDLYVKPIVRHQYLQSSLCHSYHCKKGTSYSQALKLICICSETLLINTIMIWKDFSCEADTVLFEKKYFKLVGKEILQARKIP